MKSPRSKRASIQMSKARESTCVVRIGKTKDADALSNFAGEVFRQSFGGQTARADLDLYIAQYFTPDRQLAELSDPAMITLLALCSRHLVGYRQVRVASQPERALDGLPAEIKRFYVALEWHGRGIAHE